MWQCSDCGLAAPGGADRTGGRAADAHHKKQAGGPRVPGIRPARTPHPRRLVITPRVLMSNAPEPRTPFRKPLRACDWRLQDVPSLLGILLKESRQRLARPFQVKLCRYAHTNTAGPCTYAHTNMQ